VPEPLPEEVSQQIRGEARRLLVEQIRLAFWNILVVAIVLTLGDLLFSSPGGPLLLRRFEIAALVAIPLVLHGRLVGGLTASRTAADRPFTADQVRLFEGIARHVAVAVELYKTRQADAAVASALARLGQELISSQNAPELIDRLCRVTTDIMACDVSHTYLLRQTSGVYDLVAGYGDTPEQWQALTAAYIPAELTSPLLARFAAGDVVQLLTGDFRTVPPGNQLDAPVRRGGARLVRRAPPPRHGRRSCRGRQRTRPWLNLPHLGTRRVKRKAVKAITRSAP